MNRSSRGSNMGCLPSSVALLIRMLLTFERSAQAGGRAAPHVLASSCVGSSWTVQPPPADHPEGQEPMGAQEAEPGGPSQAEPGQGPGLTGRPAPRPLQAAQPASPQLLSRGWMCTYNCPPPPQLLHVSSLLTLCPHEPQPDVHAAFWTVSLRLDWTQAKEQVFCWCYYSVITMFDAGPSEESLHLFSTFLLVFLV